MDTFINGEDDFVLGMERCLFIVNLAKWKITLYVNGQCYNQSKLFNFFWVSMTWIFLKNLSGLFRVF